MARLKASFVLGALGKAPWLKALRATPIAARTAFALYVSIMEQRQREARDDALREVLHHESQLLAQMAAAQAAMVKWIIVLGILAVTALGLAAAAFVFAVS